MVLNSDERFENPEMPAWLVLNLMNYFKTKDKDCIMGCQKLWDGIRSERLDAEQTKNERGSMLHG